MKKVIIVFLLCAIGWLVKLSFDVLQNNQRQLQLQQALSRVEKNNASLNDQIAALLRESKQPKQQQTSVAPQENAVQTLDVTALIRQQLDLVEFALMQRQNMIALEKIQQLQVDMVHYDLAPALKQSMQQALNVDQKNIQDYANALLSDQDQLNVVLQQVDHLLLQELKKPELKIQDEKQNYFWQKWFKVERSQHVALGLNQRALLLKEVQLRLLVLRQTLMQNQYLEFQQELTDLLNVLEHLPDQNSQAIQQHLEQLKRLPKRAQPQLSSRALLG